MGYITIHPADNVEVSLENGHKYAKCDIPEGSAVIKYGNPIGYATRDIKAAEQVHSHNLKTALGEIKTYTYTPFKVEGKTKAAPTVEVYVRKNGDIGIRNDIWIINTVGCINKTAEKIARDNDCFAFPHPYGCSQLGGDFETTAKILCGLITHPNAGAVLVLGLGCENTNIDIIKEHLGDYDKERIRFLCLQDCEDELTEAGKIIDELKEITSKDKRETVSAARLKIGMKCGGSDGLSGITANPLVGRICDKIASFGASAVLTEVPEMFGAEHLLFGRCVDREVFTKAVDMVNNFKKYFTAHNQPIYENPSPGNKAGGITTLEEKSLGCVQKGGFAPVTDVLTYGDKVKSKGLSLLDGPGNDMVAVTNLTACGCHMILFTTGRGTPLGAPVPTLKISTNTSLFEKKPHWMDFDAETMLTDNTTEARLLSLVLETAAGNKTRNEINGYREIAIFKDGVTL